MAASAEKTYTVTVTETKTWEVQVHASSSEEARDLVEARHQTCEDYDVNLLVDVELEFEAESEEEEEAEKCPDCCDKTQWIPRSTLCSEHWVCGDSGYCDRCGLILSEDDAFMSKELEAPHCEGCIEEFGL